VSAERPNSSEIIYSHTHKRLVLTEMNLKSAVCKGFTHGVVGGKLDLTQEWTQTQYKAGIECQRFVIHTHRNRTTCTPFVYEFEKYYFG